MTVSQRTMAAIRFGYGFHPAQTAPSGAEGVLAAISAGAQAVPLIEIQPRDERATALASVIKARKADRGSEAARKGRRKLRRQAIGEGLDALYQRALSPHGMYERLVAFWLDHFAVSVKNAAHAITLAPFEHDAIRPHVTGRFADMLTAVTQHPAMLFFLDQGASVGPSSRAGRRRGRGLNENLAREILELHTVGVDGPYSQTDVREFAELLTGYSVNRRTLDFEFFENRAEPGTETVLGQSYGGDPATASDAVALLHDLAEHPATAEHMARKMAVHFVSDTPDPDLVTHIATAWRSSGGNLPHVYQALVEHPASWRNFGAKIKRPQELVISTLRATGATKRGPTRSNRRAARSLIQTLKSMGQQIFRPPGPQGWPEEAAAWITPQGLAARLDYAGLAGLRLARQRPDLDPRRFAEATLGDALRPDTAFAVGGAPDKWEGFALVLASPEFNRR